jgi:hypothetical protein
MKKNDLVVPTDAAALLFGLFIFSVAIFWMNRVFLFDPDTYWHIGIGRWILLERTFPRHEIFSHTAAVRRTRFEPIKVDLRKWLNAIFDATSYAG